MVPTQGGSVLCVCTKFEAVLLGGPKFHPAADPLPGGAGWPKFNQLEMVTTFTIQTQFGKDRCTQFRVIVVTYPTPTDKTAYNTLRSLVIVRFPKKHVVRSELFPQNESKMYKKTTVLLHEFDDNAAVVATNVASITRGIAQFQAK